MPQAGFINGVPVKIRVMKDCIDAAKYP
ncbi:hypothetical protein ACSV8I_001919 [Salmonella enterica subsp. enterica serovar Typhi]